jgi:hypothetical protein
LIELALSPSPSLPSKEMENFEEIANRIIITKESFLPIHVPQRPIITNLLHQLNQLTSWFKRIFCSLFPQETKGPLLPSSGLSAKIGIVGAGNRITPPLERLFDDLWHRMRPFSSF